MTIDLTAVFAAYLARNRGPVPGDAEARQRPDFGVSSGLAGGVVDLALTFHAGSAYCCAEWGCHLALRDGNQVVAAEGCGPEVDSEAEPDPARG